MAKIPKKQAEQMIEAMVALGTIKESEKDEKLQELVDEGIVSSGERLGQARTEFASPEQKAIYDAGKLLLSDTRKFWETNDSYKFLQSQQIKVGVENKNGEITGTTDICVEPSVALKNNKVVIASFDVEEESESS